MTTFITELRNTFIFRPQQQLVSKCVILGKWVSHIWISTNSLLLLSQYASTHSHTCTYTHTHILSYPQIQTVLGVFFVWFFWSWLQILTLTLTCPQRPSLKRQETTLKERILCTRSRHQPLISQINYRIAIRRHHSAARKWKQKNCVPGANSHTHKKEGRIDGEASQCKQNPSPHSFDYLTSKNNKRN